MDAPSTAPLLRAKSPSAQGSKLPPWPAGWARRIAPWFVGGVFAAMLAAAHLFVARYASVVPFWDDLGWTHVLSDRELGWDWWWSQYNEHRIPLPRVFLVPLLEVTRDFRAGMHAEVLVLGLMALAMILVARHLRGRSSTADACFPLLWLSWGGADVLLMMHMFSMVLPMALASAILLRIATLSEPLRVRDSALIGACLLGLPLCGGPGVTTAPALILWALYAGSRSIHSGTGRRAGLLLWGFGLATALAIGAYFIGYANPNPDDYSRDAARIAAQALMFLSLAFGPAAQEHWPLSGALTAALLLGLIYALLRVLRRRPEERARAAGLLAVAAGVVSMALSAGIARGGQHGDPGFSPRYMHLPALLLCCAYFSSCVFGSRLVARWVQGSLCALLFLLLPYDLRFGRYRGEHRRAESESFLADVAAGSTIRQLSARHWRWFAPRPSMFEHYLRELHDARAGPVAAAALDATDSPYFMFRTAPVRATSTRDVGPRRIGYEFVLLVHPPCELVFDPQPGAALVRGRFGILPEAYEALGTSGARFSVEWSHAAGATEVLFERVLRPREQAADRGFQALAVALPAAADGALVLRASYAQEQGDEHAWCFWTDVEIR